MVSGTASPSSHGHERSLHGAPYQELPEERDRDMIVAMSPRSSSKVSRTSSGGSVSSRLSFLDRRASETCNIYDDPEGVTAVILLSDITPDVAFKFISKLENFIHLSKQIRYSAHKGKKTIGSKISVTEYLDITTVRRKWCFWSVMETCEASFEYQFNEQPFTITFICSYPDNRKVSTQLSIEEESSGTRVVSRVVSSEMKSRSFKRFYAPVLYRCLDQNRSNIRNDQKTFLYGLQEALWAARAPSAAEFEDDLNL